MTNGSEFVKFLSETFFNQYKPCQLYINNNSQTEIKNGYSFNNINSINVIRIFWDKRINTIVSMFSNCNKIIEIELSKFDASEVTSIDSMFLGCSSLSYINFSYFNTSNVNMMNSVFYYCSSLITLDLSNFDVSEVSQIGNMFSYCEKLEYINFKKAQFREGIFNTDMLLSAYEKLMVCLEKENSVFSTLKNTKRIYSNNNNSYQEKLYICYSKESPFNNKFICDICGNNYYIKNNVPNDNTYMNCCEEIEGYYLDKIDLNFKPCYISCKICKINGDYYTNNCIECKEEYKYEINISNSNFKNCYITNIFQTIISETNMNKYESTLIHNENQLL